MSARRRCLSSLALAHVPPSCSRPLVLAADISSQSKTPLLSVLRVINLGRLLRLARFSLVSTKPERP